MRGASALIFAKMRTRALSTKFKWKLILYVQLKKLSLKIGIIKLSEYKNIWL